ncbi:methyltransferase FkbM family [Geitlerinema sp. FC II]|nr:methyltransferase FkbM family [Geitlerinema sp. FC II]
MNDQPIESQLESPFEYYWNYLQQAGLVDERSTAFDRVREIVDCSDLDDPQQSNDLNNFAVLALVEAEQSDTRDSRAFFVNLALDALNAGWEYDRNLLCAMHLAIVSAMTGNLEDARETVTSNAIANLDKWFQHDEASTPSLLGLVYLPPVANRSQNKALIEFLFNAKNTAQQALALSAEAICLSQLILYTDYGLRWLNVATKLLPSISKYYLSLGVYQASNGHSEGLLSLHCAYQLDPESPRILQALYLAYRDLGNDELARYWLDMARRCRSSDREALEWQWVDLNDLASYTTLKFDSDILLSVEPSFNSIATSVILVELDWFEKELEFWRNSLQAGMTVIDVGANVGTYTFSAARKVGSEGRVLAIEPFSKCVKYLKQTCQTNRLDWITVCEGAASSKNGSAQLLLHRANELNEVTIDSSVSGILEDETQYEEIQCFTLDRLVEDHNLEAVDFLKIDAEGHEMSVLAGAPKLFQRFSPIVLYENIAGRKSRNLPVANCLRALGYKLFIYQPYLEKLIYLESDRFLSQTLNVIAVPDQKLDDFLD